MCNEQSVRGYSPAAMHSASHMLQSSVILVLCTYVCLYVQYVVVFTDTGAMYVCMSVCMLQSSVYWCYVRMYVYMYARVSCASSAMFGDVSL